MDELLTASVRTLAGAIRRKEVSPVEVVRAHLDRIQQVDPYLNAVCHLLDGPALAAAEEAEARVLREDPDTLPPFLGVPCTIKEHYAVAGLPRTAGLLRRREAVSPEDATPVRRMREAGFIVLGTTNVPEGLTWFETYNHVYGRTHNPWDVRRIPGGSSGGEASVIGAGGSPVGLGGDVGGSIRNPAFFCGVAGHKPSGGVVPETGAWPGVRGPVARMKVVGPLARSVDDLEAVMPVLAGPDGIDLSADDRPWPERPGLRPEEITVLVSDRIGFAGPSRAVADGLRRAEDALRDRGFQVRRWTPPGLDRAYELWANALEHSGAHSFSEQLADFGEFSLAEAWWHTISGRPRHILPALLLATVEQLLQRFPSYGADLAAQVPEVQAAVEAALGDRGVWMLPSFHREAPRHGAGAFAALPGFIYSAILNPLELPATAVPTGFSRQGLPVGVQIAGRRWNDRLTLHVAHHVEDALGGWQPPMWIEGTPLRLGPLHRDPRPEPRRPRA